MPWQAENPFATAVGTAAGFLQSSQDAKLQAQQRAQEQARQQKLDQDNAVAHAAALAHQKFEEGVETKRLGYEGNADTRATTQAADTHASEVLDTQVKRANFDFDKQTRPLQIKAMILQIALQNGQVHEQQYAIQKAAIDQQMSQIQLGIAKKYSVPEEDLRLAQGYAGLDQTAASTAATRQNTAFGAQEEPLRQAQGRADLLGSNIRNAQGWQGLTKPTDTGVDFNDPLVKQLSKDSDGALKAWESRRNKITSGQTPAIELPDGSYAMPDDLVDSDDPSKGLQKGKKPVLAAPPEDFSTFAAALGTVIDNVRTNPKNAARVLQQITADTTMTPAQKAYAKKQIQRAASAKPPQTGGGPGGSSPFGSSQSSQVVRDAATEFGVPPQILDAVWQQESSRGATLTANGRSADPKNAGHGWFQLDPASGAPPEALQRAARDPKYASRVAANQLAGLYRQYGSWPAALAAYNSGSPGNPKGDAYANEVLGRIAP